MWLEVRNGHIARSLVGKTVWLGTIVVSLGADSLAALVSFRCGAVHMSAAGRH